MTFCNFRTDSWLKMGNSVKFDEELDEKSTSSSVSGFCPTHGDGIESYSELFPQNKSNQKIDKQGEKKRKKRISGTDYLQIDFYFTSKSENLKFFMNLQ